MIPIDAIQTLTGYFDFFAPQPEQVNLEEIAHTLAFKCRFGGHIKQFYSVAQHACFIHDRMLQEGWSKADSLYGLHHDDHETYAGDITRPLKRYLKSHLNFDYNVEVADKIDAVIYPKIGLQFPMPIDVAKAITHYDVAALFTEKEYLFETQMDWGHKMNPYPKDVFEPYMDNSKDWKKEFLARC